MRGRYKSDEGERAVRAASPWAAHFRVFAVDLIGDAGLSAPSRPPLESDAHALWLNDVMDGLSQTAPILEFLLASFTKPAWPQETPARSV